MHSNNSQEYIKTLGETVINSMKQHGTDWKKPWVSTAVGLPENTSGHKYQGSNIFVLWFWTHANGFQSNRWATYKGWQAEGKQISKGSKHVKIIRYGTYEDKKTEEKKQFIKVYPVFNEQQTEDFKPKEIELVNKAVKIKNVEKFIGKLGATIKDAQSAFYRPDDDIIGMPIIERFDDTNTATATENYYSTLLHEHVHWSGAKKRLDREGVAGTTRTEKTYAFEELVAEFGAAILCMHKGISDTCRPDHAKYLNHWLKHLPDNPKLVLQAMSQASKAVTYLLEKGESNEKTN